MAIGRVIGGFFVLIWRGLDGLRKILHLLLLLFLFAIVLAALQGSIPSVPAKAALRLNLEGRLVEQFSGDPIERAFSRAASDVAPETRLRDVLDALDAAATDKRIHLVVLDMDRMEGAGMSQLQEIAAALARFRASGKKIVAIGGSYNQAQYYLAAQANEIYLDPMGFVFVQGFDHYRQYFKGTLDKLAVDVNVFKVGTYKSYMEGFTRTDMSPEEREESLAVLNGLWSMYQADVSKARKLAPGALEQYVNQAALLMQRARGDSAKVALDQGLVTALKSRQDVGVEIEKIVGQDKDSHLFNSVPLDHYLSVVHSEKALEHRAGDEVGVVVAVGDIVDGYQPGGRIGSDSTGEVLRDARYDDSIKAVVLRIDSPGGDVFASEQIYREVRALRESGKPVIVSMGDVAASGGYYIAMGADEVWASPTTITGSIGIFGVAPTFQRTLEKIGVTVDGVGTTALSGEFRLDRPLGKSARTILQSGVEHGYATFLERVAENRGRPPQEIDRVAQGRVWIGSDAKERGLVDSLGSLQQAIDAAASRAKLKKYKPKYLDPEPTWQEALAAQFQATLVRIAVKLGFEVQPPQTLRRVLDPVQQELKRWGRFSNPQRLYSYCFCTVQ